MAGNDNPAPDQIPEENPPEKKAHKVRSFSCPNCGAAISMRNPDSLSVVCDSCHTIIDSSDENYRILQTYRGNTKLFSPRIELGSRGELFKHKWECIGFMAREDTGSHYLWEEYLLFNPFEGYRWLMLADGHWNFVRQTKDQPVDAGTHKIRLKDKTYRLFYRGQASNLFVMGEFYWKVAQGNTVTMEDYIDPPEMLSSEADDHEGNWSLATYVEPTVIEKAFTVRHDSRNYRSGVAPNQPSASTQTAKQVGKWWMFFVVLLTAIQIAHASSTTNKLAFIKDYQFPVNAKSQTSTTTPIFEFQKESANVQISLRSPVDNSWFYLAGDLVNNDTGVTYSFDRSIEYYHGYDSDGAWAEGDRTSNILIHSVPAGKYYLSFDTESGSFPDSNAMMLFSVEIWRDCTTYSDYFLCLFLLSIIPGIYWLASYSYESQRWSDSNYSPYPRSE